MADKRQSPLYLSESEAKWNIKYSMRFHIVQIHDINIRSDEKSMDHNNKEDATADMLVVKRR